MLVSVGGNGFNFITCDALRIKRSLFLWFNCFLFIYRWIFNRHTKSLFNLRAIFIPERNVFLYLIARNVASMQLKVEENQRAHRTQNFVILKYHLHPAIPLQLFTHRFLNQQIGNSSVKFV